ncbi:MAG: phosphatase PAP2 family protein [Burkholderiales bacterium]|nr:phosphatase PAP2 family protein [Burkholderiales bacterium]
MLNRATIIFFILVAGFVIVSPGIDQYFAAMTYNADRGKFYGELHLWCRIVYYSIPAITALLVAISVGMLFTRLKKVALIILLSLALGPGLVINVVFKDHWGRPRPYQVIRDGETFLPVWQPNFNQINDNSFPCGHASIGFFLGVPFLACGQRKRGLIIGLIAGGFVGVVRMLQGGHYLSDVVFCGIFVWMAAYLVIYWVNKIKIAKGII